MKISNDLLFLNIKGNQMPIWSKQNRDSVWSALIVHHFKTNDNRVWVISKYHEPNDGGNDVFVHISAVQKSGLKGLAEDQLVNFELVEGRDGRQMADELSLA